MIDALHWFGAECVCSLDGAVDEPHVTLLFVEGMVDERSAHEAFPRVRQVRAFEYRRGVVGAEVDLDGDELWTVKRVLAATVRELWRAA